MKKNDLQKRTIPISIFKLFFKLPKFMNALYFFFSPDHEIFVQVKLPRK